MDYDTRIKIGSVEREVNQNTLLCRNSKMYHTIKTVNKNRCLFDNLDVYKPLLETYCNGYKKGNCMYMKR